jgi:hypothetical protein
MQVTAILLAVHFVASSELVVPLVLNYSNSRISYSAPPRRHVESNQNWQRPYEYNSANKALPYGKTGGLYWFAKMSDTLLLVTELFLPIAPPAAHSVDWQVQRSCLKALSNIHGLGKHWLLATTSTYPEPSL